MSKAVRSVGVLKNVSLLLVQDHESGMTSFLILGESGRLLGDGEVRDEVGGVGGVQDDG